MPPDQPATDSRAELIAALDSLGITIASSAGRARGFGYPSALPPGLNAAPTWRDPEMAAAISQHLDDVGLDDLTLTLNSKSKQEQ